MNNEEKILQVLEKHGEMLEGLGKRLEVVETLSQRTAVLLETDYADKLRLLFDGHTEIMQKMDDLTPRNRVEELEDDVAMLKDVIKLMRQDIAELKKAQ